jgi:hypothetical protein
VFFTKRNNKNKKEEKLFDGCSLPVLASGSKQMYTGNCATSDKLAGVPAAGGKPALQGIMCSYKTD